MAAVCAAAIMLGTGCVRQTDAGAGAKSELTVQMMDERYPGWRDDFYEAVNKAQFDEWEIPADEASADHFTALAATNSARLQTIMKDAAKDATEGGDADTRTVGALWATGTDMEARNAGGLGAAQRFLDEVDAARNIEQLMDVEVRFDREYGYHSFFGLGITTAADDSSKKMVQWGGVDHGLTREEWFSDDEETRARVGHYTELLCGLWEEIGTSRKDAEAKVAAVTAAMKELAGESLSVADLYDVEKTHNVHTAAELAKQYAGVLPFGTVYERYGLEPDDEIVVGEERLLAASIDFIKNADLQLVKDYVTTCLLYDTRWIGTQGAYAKAERYFLNAYGLEEVNFEKSLTRSISDTVLFECGRLYAAKHYDAAVEQDIRTMVDDIVKVYERRIRNLEWMGDTTKQEAIKKLSSLTVNIGVPQTWPQDRYHLNLKMPDEGGLYVDNVLAVNEANRDVSFALKDEPVDKTQWLMGPHEVNAYYDPPTNSITLLAGILDSPFYSAEASEEENLGGIGAVIAHEITHGFDSDGSKYDESGNVRDWWSEEDAQQFSNRTAMVVDYYGGQEIRGYTVNGAMTLGENIADLGAVSCISEIVHNRGLDAKRMYVAYAQTWAEEIRDEYLANLIATDTHPPSKVRVNAALAATKGFYDAFGIGEDDGMYVAQKDRPSIW